MIASTICLADITIVVIVILGVRPAALRVFVICNRLGTDVDDMVDVRDFERMFASIDWSGTLVGGVGIA